MRKQRLGEEVEPLAKKPSRQTCSVQARAPLFMIIDLMFTDFMGTEPKITMSTYVSYSFGIRYEPKNILCSL
ncbi:hypothetical protein I79_002332 [Cricetulus griseus]|uniref:Uncharacterized protein n=1 Tax=Cricetulus griseus TaxID=10029 RepID=G3GX97_CRIGR|nr:hypothetical protein I79_002332 [Cricetulus griseus]